MTTVWNIKTPSGIIRKKQFPYVSNFWRVTTQEVAYFAGLSADIGMEPDVITEAADAVVFYLKKSGVDGLVIGSDTHSLASEDGISAEELLHNLLQDRGSVWYGDAVWLSGTGNDFNV